MKRLLFLVSLVWCICLAFPVVNAGELDISIVPNSSGYVVHVDVAKALQDKANGKIFYQRWIFPMLDGYGGNIAPKNTWNSNTVSSITFFGTGSYSDYETQVFVFTPTSPSWLKEIRKGLNTDSNGTNAVRFSKNGYTAILTGKHLYVSKSKEAVSNAVMGKKGGNSLFKAHTVGKSYLILLMDSQFRDVFDFPFSFYLSKNMNSACMSVQGYGVESSPVALEFSLAAGIDPAIFVSRSRKVVQSLSLVENDWSDFLATCKMEASGNNLLMKNDLDRNQYQLFLSLLFGV